MTRRLLACIAACVIGGFAAPAAAQISMPPEDLCAGVAGTLVVGSGQTRTVTGVLSCIRVDTGGTLVLADGAIVGTVHARAGSIVRCANPATITINSQAPTDPEQWRTGLVLEGRIECAGTAKVAWTRATQSIPARSQTIAVAETTGWQVGDIVQIADSRELVPGPGEPVSRCRTARC